MYNKTKQKGWKEKKLKECWGCFFEKKEKNSRKDVVMNGTVGMYVVWGRCYKEIHFDCGVCLWEL